MKFFPVFLISFALALAGDASTVAPDTLPNGLKHMKMIDMVDLHSRSKAFHYQVLLVAGSSATVPGDLSELVGRYAHLATSTELLYQQNGDASPLITLKNDTKIMKDSYMEKVSKGEISTNNISSYIDAIKNLARNITVEVDKVLAVASVILPNGLKRLNTTEISDLQSHSQDFDDQLIWVYDNVAELEQADLQELASRFGVLRPSTALLCPANSNCTTLRTLYTKLDTLDNDHIKKINDGTVTTANIADYIEVIYDLGEAAKVEVDKVLAFYTLPNGLSRMEVAEISALRSHSQDFVGEMNAVHHIANQAGSTINQETINQLTRRYNALSASTDLLYEQNGADVAALDTLEAHMDNMLNYLNDVRVDDIAYHIGEMKTLAENIKVEVDKIVAENIKEPSNPSDAAAATTTQEPDVQSNGEETADETATGGTRLLGFLA